MILEVVIEEVGDGVVLSKDKDGEVLGFGKQCVTPAKQKGGKSYRQELTAIQQLFL